MPPARFAFELCLALGGGRFPHPDFLLPRLTGQQLADWEAHFRDRPFGHRVLQLMLAQLAVMQAASHGVSTDVDAYMPQVKSNAEDEEDGDALFRFPGAAEIAAQLAARATAPSPPQQPPPRLPAPKKSKPRRPKKTKPAGT